MTYFAIGTSLSPTPPDLIFKFHLYVCLRRLEHGPLSNKITWELHLRCCPINFKQINVHIPIHMVTGHVVSSRHL